jgi:glycosyltransferase involved in cell wall biosynthesis
MSTSLDIAIPVLNEEQSLRERVLTLHHFLEENLQKDLHWQIVIADNGSTDRTAKIAEELSNQFKDQISLISVGERGVGKALKAAWDQSSADIVGFMDLDLATDLKHLSEALHVLMNNEADLSMGTRLHPNSKVINRSFKREFSSRAFNSILKNYLKVSFSDGMCGFKFVRREIYNELRTKGLSIDGWFFSTELLVRAEWNNFRIHEIPVKWTDDQNSKAKVGSLAIQYLKEMKKLKSERYAH